jgi:dihydroorotate dehydrogenase electron transfer subunit
MPGGAMLLPRPISIADADPDTGEISLIYASVGAGTQALSLLRPSGTAEPSVIEAMGPLGTGFLDFSRELKHVLLIGGGVGVPPLLFAAKKLRETYGKDIEIAAFLGYRKEPWLDERFGQICDEVHTVSEPPTVIDLLDDSTLAFSCDTLALSCGPRPMLAAVSSWCYQRNIDLRVSLEERMGCGYGACAGCTAKTRPLDDPRKPQNGPDNPDQDGIIKKKVCVHGPVFWAEEVVW